MLRLLFVPLLLAVSVADVPNPRSDHGGWVTDLSDTIPDAEEAQIEAQLERMHQKHAVEIALVTVPSVPGQPKEFATKLFNHWGIGDAKTDTGLLVLLVMDKRRLEMETGYGLESRLPDAWIVSMQRQHMIPSFKEGDFAKGLRLGLDQVDLQLATGLPPASTTTSPRNSEVISWSELVSAFLPFILFCVLLWGMGRAIDRTSGSKKANPKTASKKGLRSWGPFRWTLPKDNPDHPLWHRRCWDCGVPRIALDEEVEDDHLDEGQQAEEELGSVQHTVFFCSSCSSVQLKSRRKWFSRYIDCWSCNKRTASAKSKTLRAATTSSTGRAEVTEDCLHCEKTRTYTKVLPRLPQPSSSSSGSGGGSSFGGGSSGGGGGGSSW